VAATTAADSVDAIAAAFPASNVAPLTPAKPLLESAARSLRARLLSAEGRHDDAIRLLERNVRRRIRWG
jgi:hypothetical protein